MNENGQNDTVPKISILGDPKRIQEVLDRYREEIATYRRELPRLLQEGQAGRHILIKGDKVIGIWPKHADAMTAGYERYGVEPFFVHGIDPRDQHLWAFFEAQFPDSCPR